MGYVWTAYVYWPMTRKQLVSVGVALSAIIWLASAVVRSALEKSRRNSMPDDGYSITNGLFFRFACRPEGTLGVSRFECEIKNVSDTNLTIRKMVHGLNLNCWYRPVGGATYKTSQFSPKWL